MAALFTFLEILCFLVGVVWLLTIPVTQSSIVYPIIFGVISIVFGTLSKRAKNKKIYPVDLNIRSLGRAQASASGYALTGLPFGECACDVAVHKRAVVFSANGNFSSLDISKIISADVKTRQEMTSASVGSAVLGTVAFGIIGTVIASRPKSKTEYILVINYNDINGEIQTIAIAFPKILRRNAEDIARRLNKLAPHGTYTRL